MKKIQNLNIQAIDLGSHFVTHGSLDKLYKVHGLDGESVKEKALEVGIQTCRLCSFSECSFVHSRGAGADYHAGELIVTDGILYHVLTGFRAHILVIYRVNYAVFV